MGSISVKERRQILIQQKAYWWGPHIPLEIRFNLLFSSGHGSVLQAQVRVLREQVDSTPMPVVAQKLIDEKNAEIDELSLQVQQLQEDLAENSLVQEANNQVQQLVSSSVLFCVVCLYKLYFFLSKPNPK